MDLWQKISENRIKEAMENGEFDNLPAQGRRIDHSDYFSSPPSLRIQHLILKNAGTVPPEVALMREIDQLETKKKASGDASLKKQYQIRVEEKRAALQLMIERRKLRG